MLDSKKWKIIQEVLDNPDDEIHIRDLAKKLKVSPGLVSITVKKMASENLLKGRKPDIENPLVRSYKILLNIKKLSKLAPILRRGGAAGFGAYGSFARGVNTKSSDVDLWIKVNSYPAAPEAAKLRAEIREKIKAEPSILFLTDKKIGDLRKNNKPLYYSIYHGFHLWGEHVD